MFAFFFLLLSFGFVLLSREAGLLADAPPPWWWVWAGLVATTVIVWAVGLAMIRGIFIAVVIGRWRMASSLGTLYSVLQLGAFLLVLLPLKWGAWVASFYVAGTSVAEIPVLGELALIAPALLIAAVGIWARYPLDAALRPGAWTRATHFNFNFRWMVAPLPLLLVMQLVRGLLSMAHRDIEAIQRAVFLYPSLGLLLELIPLAVALIVFPFFLRVMFATKRLPDGPLRTRLEAAAKRVGVRYRDLLIWQTGRARVPNALVTGLFGRARYIFLSDAMLHYFPENELEAVFCHELGHVKHRHLYLYVAVLLGLVIAFDAAIVPLSLDLGVALSLAVADIEALQTAVLPVMMLGVVVFLMTVVSRMNERQADLTGSRFAADPLAIATALERINMLLGGGIRDRPSPTHGSIATRVGFIAAAVRDPDIGRRFERKIGRWHRTLFFIAGISVLTAALPVGEQMADASARNAVFDTIENLHDELDTADLIALRQDLARLATQFPNDATLEFFRGLLAEDLAGMVQAPEAKRRELLAATRHYDAAWNATGRFNPARARILRANERATAALSALTDSSKSDSPDSSNTAP